MPTDNSRGVITGVHLCVPSLAQLELFYRDVMGMHLYQRADYTMSFAFDESRCHLTFREDNVTAFVDNRAGFYWKIGITVKNLDIAVAFLREKGVEVSPPRQFLDIGYMSHLRDPNGFNIELLQQGFKGREQPATDGHPIASQATLAHVTLRVTDIHAAEQYLVNHLGMRLMSVQSVSEFNFCLYFYTWSDEALPNSDVQSVDNREWLWARPYTLIEVQHLLSPEATVHHRPSGAAGFEGITCRQAVTQKHGRAEEVFLTLEQLG